MGKLLIALVVAALSAGATVPTSDEITTAIR